MATLPPDAIWAFNGRYRYLSNFYIEPDGTHVEGEFQASKCARPGDVKSFLGLKPGDAKRLGRRVKLRPDWEQVKVDIMYELVYRKFTDHPLLGVALWETRPARLEEGNTWGDTFWGVCDGVGLNNLGIILMAVREEVIPF